MQKRRSIIVFVDMEIMKLPFYSRRLTSVAFLLVSTGLSLSAGELVLQQVPAFTVEQSGGYPENLARYRAGAQIEAAPKSHSISDLQLGLDQNNAEAALLCDDPTIGYALPVGKSTVLIALPKIQSVARISFLNSDARGEVSAATASAKLSPDSPQWHGVFQQPLSPEGVHADFGPGEVKYVRLSFNITQPGRIAGLGVYSSSQVTDFTATRTHEVAAQDKSDSFALISCNLTDVHLKARALFVSSGSDLRQASNMIDAQSDTAYNFASSDRDPTAIIDLGHTAALRRLSAVYTPQAGKVEFYVLKALPGALQSKKGAPSAVRLDDNAWADMKSVGSVTDDSGRGRAAVDFPATTGRYIMVRWTPSNEQDSSFGVTEVAAFGTADQSNTLFAYTSGGRTTTETGDGKTMIEAKDAPAEGPETDPQPPADGPPPTLPQPPPFTFVPVLAPTSP